MLPFPKTCGVCDQTCNSKEEWAQHLLQLTHSNRTKDPCHSWMNGPPEVKKRSLLTMGECDGPLDRRGILDYFGSGGCLVVDIFYCSCHPYFAMFQFESKTKAVQLLKEMGSEISINGRVVRLKKASRPRKRILVTPNTVNDEEVVSKKQKASDCSTDGAVTKELAVALMTPVKNNAVDANLSREKLVQEVVTKKKAKTKPSKQTVDDTEKLEERSSDNLVKEYADICSLVEISSQELQLISDLLKRINEVFKQHYPTVTLTLFRHWYLKLRNGGSNQLLVYLSEANYQPLGVSHEDIEKMLRSIIGIDPWSSGHQNEVEAGIPYHDGTSSYYFELITDGNFRAEVSKCCWTSHLIKLDARAKSLLTLVHFWARENKVTLAEDGIAKKQQFDAIPDPGALEWLCVLFLVHEKIIPHPDEVMDRKKGGQELSQATEGTWFIPFSENCSDFMDSWKARKGTTSFVEGSKEYILDVMRLARDFFQFRTSTSGSFCSFSEAKFESSIEPLMQMTARKLDVFLATRDQNVVGADLKSLFRPEGLLNPAPSKVSMKLELEQMMADVEKELKAKHQNIMDLKCGCQLASGVCDAELLRCHFSSEVVQDDLRVMSEMQVEDIRNTQQKLKELFEAAGLVNCNLISFRSGHLKLLYGDPFSGDDVYFFLDHDGLYGERNGKREVLQVNANMRQEMINKVESKGVFEDMWLLVEPFLEVLAVGENEDMSKLDVSDSSGTADFSIGPRFYFPEVQASQLVEYLTMFDPRVKPLLAVVFYWVDVNDIRLGKVGQEYERIGFAPEPAVLEWLVLYFLGSKRILPSPNEIILRSPGASLFFDGVDVGFKVDVEHAREWRSRYKEKNEEKHVWNVYSLAKQFFAFCHDMGKKAKVKPMVIDLKFFRCFAKCEMNRINDNDEISKLSGVSVDNLRLINSEPKIREGFYSPSEALTFLHPVHVKYGFSFCCDTFLKSICPKMGAMSERLQKLLGTYSKKGRKKHGMIKLDDSYDDDEVNAVFKL